MDSLFQLIGSAGIPTSFTGLLLLIFFYVQKNSAVIRAEIVGSLERVQRENIELQSTMDKQTVLIDELRQQKRDAEDVAHAERRRANDAEDKLRRNGIE